MKIVELSRVYPTQGCIGGMERHSLNLSEGLAALGHEVHVLTTSHPVEDATEILHNKVIVHHLPCISKQYSEEYFSLTKKWVDIIKPDIIHSESSSCKGLLDSSRIPIIATFWGLNWEFMRADLRLYKLTNDEWYLEDFKARLPKHFEDFNVVRKVARIVAVNEMFRHDFVNDFFEPLEKVELIYPGVDQTLFKPLQPLDRPFHDPIRLLCVGRLAKDKGYNVVFGAMQKYLYEGNITLTLVGAGNIESWKKLASNMGISEKVNFIQNAKYEDMPAIYNDHDIFIDPTLRYTGIDFTVMEAMSCGIPVIVSDQGFTYIDDNTPASNVCFNIFAMGDAWSLSCEIMDIIGHDPKNLKRLRKANLEIARSYFDRNSMVERYDGLFNSL